MDATQPDLLEPGQTRSISASAESARVDGEVEIIKSAPTLLRVIETEDLLNDAYFAPRPSREQQLSAFLGLGEPRLSSGEQAVLELVARLRNALTVQRHDQTNLISIEANADEPDVAARLANAVAASHIELRREAEISALAANLDLLASQLTGARGEVVSSERAIEQFFDDHLEQMAAETGEPGLIRLRSELVDQQAASRRLEGAIERATAYLRGHVYDDVVDALELPALREIDQRRRQTLVRIALAPAPGAAAPALEAELQALQQQFEVVARNEIATLKTVLATHRERVASLKEQIRSNLMGSRLSPPILTRVYELQQIATLARANYERLVMRVGDLRARSELQQADSIIIASATPPLQPSSMSLSLVAALFGLFGVGLGLGVALVVDIYTGGFTSHEQLEAITRREVAAGIPLIKPVRQKGGGWAPSFADAVALAPLSSYAESLRRLRLRLDLRLPALSDMGVPQGRVVVVSSAVSDEGKTTTALGLARTYGLAGKQVLIIDGDLRRPALFRHLDAAPVAGLLDYLTGALPPEALITAVGTDPLSGISTVVNARQSEGPTEHLLTNAAFRSLIRAARKSFDLIIIDTPPIGTIVDGVYAMQLADAAIMLTRYAHTRQRDVMRSLDVLERARPDMPPVLLAMTQQPDTARFYGPNCDAHYVVTQ